MSGQWERRVGRGLAVLGVLWLVLPPLLVLVGAGWIWLLSHPHETVSVFVAQGGGVLDTLLAVLLWPVLPALLLYLGQRLSFGGAAGQWQHLRPLLRLAGGLWLLLPPLAWLFFWAQSKIMGVGWTFYYPLNYRPQVALWLACWLVPGLLLLWLSRRPRYSRLAQ